MDRTVVKKTTLEGQDEAFCLSLSLNDRLRVLEELNRQGRILAGYPNEVPLNRNVSRSQARAGDVYAISDKC